MVKGWCGRWRPLVSDGWVHTVIISRSMEEGRPTGPLRVRSLIAAALAPTATARRVLATSFAQQGVATDANGRDVGRGVRLKEGSGHIQTAGHAPGLALSMEPNRRHCIMVRLTRGGGLADDGVAANERASATYGIHIPWIGRGLRPADIGCGGSVSTLANDGCRGSCHGGLRRGLRGLHAAHMLRRLPHTGLRRLSARLLGVPRRHQTRRSVKGGELIRSSRRRRDWVRKWSEESGRDRRRILWRKRCDDERVSTKLGLRRRRKVWRRCLVAQSSGFMRWCYLVVQVVIHWGWGGLWACTGRWHVLLHLRQRLRLRHRMMMPDWLYRQRRLHWRQVERGSLRWDRRDRGRQRRRRDRRAQEWGRRWRLGWMPGLRH